MTDPIPPKKIEVWMTKLDEKLTGLNSFQDTEYWTNFSNEWQARVYDLLEQDHIEYQTWIEEIYTPLCILLDEAQDNITWRGKSEDAFKAIRGDFVYPLAYELHNKRKYLISNDLCDEISEFVVDDIDDFIFGGPIHNKELLIPLNPVSISPGAKVYMGSTKASNLHLICDVPAIASDISHESTVQRILDRNLARDQWQRQLIKSRVKHITSFLSRQFNFFVNPVIIFLPDENNKASIVINAGSGHNLSVNFDSFVNFGVEKPTLFGDDRPLAILDGQHRVRGAARSVTGANIEIPFILVPSTYSMDQAAKLFAEINTTSKELEIEHQMFLAYRYNLPHHSPDLTMEEYDPQDPKPHDRANRMAYKFGALLCQNGRSLYSQIMFLKANPGSYSVEVTKWQKYVKTWFMPGSCYDHSTDLNDDEILTEVDNYFLAWKRVIGDSWVEHGESGWNSRSIFQYKTHFRVLLRRFMQVRGLAKIRHPNARIISSEHFHEILIPLDNLDSASSELKASYNKTGEFYWQCMDAWVQDAIGHGVSYDRDEVMSSQFRGSPGKGVFAHPLSPSSWVVNDDHRGNWPLNGPRYLEVFRPSNCHPSLRVSVHDGEEVLSDVSRKTITADGVGASCRVPIRYNKIPNDTDHIEVRLRWRTATGDLEKIISINRPD